jgi:tetratricopeptide (TPR) repeat protein/O-antigen ligase
MSTLEKTLRWVVIGGAFLLPFVVTFVANSLFFPYITGKNFAFRLIVEVMAGAWLALALVNPAYRPKRSWILGALSLFVLILAVADAMGVVPFKSFWSNFERMDGWITLVHLLVYTVIAASVINTEKLWKWLWWTTLGVSVYLAVYGLLQLAGVTTLGQGGSAGLGARIDATLGNPIYFAVYMLFHIFIAAMLWAQSWAARARGTRLAPSLAYGFIIVVETLALFFTGTRGTMLGLIGGALLAAVLYALVRGSWRVRGAVAGIFALVVLAGFGVYGARDSAFVQDVGFLSRLATISISDPTIKARFLNMGIAWEGVKERPLLGWGQENYAIVFDKHFDPRMYGQEDWFDRVHNSIFDWWIAGGTLGLLAYLSIFLAALWALWRPLFIRNEQETFSVAERSILTGLLAGYFVHNLTVFDNVTSYILFGTVLAYIVWRDTAARGVAAVVRREVLARGTLPYVALACAVLTVGIAWWANATALAQNRALIAAISPQEEGVAKNLELFKDTIFYGSYGTQEAREQLAQGAARLASVESVSLADKQAFYTLAVEEVEAQAKASPLDARPRVFVGVVHRAYGNYDAAEQAFVRAEELSPGKQTILFQLGDTLLLSGKPEQALAAYREAYEAAPQFTDVRLRYAAAAIRAGYADLADELLEPLIESGEAADQYVLTAYASQSNFQPAIRIWQARVAAQPHDIQAFATLASLYYEIGDHVSARRVLEEGKAANPDAAAQFDSLLSQLQ